MCIYSAIRNPQSAMASMQISARTIKQPQEGKRMSDRVLIVDDDESVRWVLKKALEKEGVEVVLARDAQEGFARLADGTVSLVLMDIRMPGMSGLDALEKIKQDGRNVAVIIMTAQATMQNAIEAMRRGA